MAGQELDDQETNAVLLGVEVGIGEDFLLQKLCVIRINF